jgi:hypothetical protein
MGKNRSPYELAVIGRCIYCPSLDVIGVEHIIPESLGGKLYLTDASCEPCADKTKEFERSVARAMYWPLKLALGIKGKRSHKKQRPTHWRMEIGEGDEWAELQVEVGKLPKVYVAAEFPLPGIVTGQVPNDRSPEFNLQIKGNKTAMAAFAKEFGAGKLEIGHHFAWGPFCRMLAKVAHAYTVGKFGFGGLDFLLPPLIRGDADYLAYLVGGIGEPTIGPVPDLQLRLRWIGRSPFVTARISLFGGRLPTYEVVSAEVRDLNLIIPKMRAATV